ncbi:hypothetical protein FRB94_011094 [Tulasnella sp. JGI-2019a]|nr:hypothetical protein FRB94_011094 [Tulasnella sp. JGI-2019a]KAG8998871.1 hypothetical protein FRB93_013438 [Tulasnella sp. JGI-2019a]KAG9030360.1 hypothetical protein FRB95_004015 [Tulasnella sp. JGI-2019a]
MPSWKRLIRFKAVETNEVHLGQPVDSDVDVGLAALQKKAIKVHEVTGASAFDPNAKVTSKILTVKELLEPLSREQVGSVRCIGLNYTDHAAEAKMALPDRPNLFYKPATVIIGPNAPIVIPKVCQPIEHHRPDYEVELVIVIGKVALNVPEPNALDYVLGYTVGNDISFRYHQLAVSQWCFSKSFDDTTPLGPCIVAASEINSESLRVMTTLNGEVRQDGTTANLIFGVKKLVAYLSQGTTLSPGTIIYTGTPKGVGAFANPPITLKHGDDVRVWIEHIGTLANPVVEEGVASQGAKL